MTAVAVSAVLMGGATPGLVVVGVAAFRGYLAELALITACRDRAELDLCDRPARAAAAAAWGAR